MEVDKDLNNILKWFWDLEIVGIIVKYSERIDMITNNKLVWKKFEWFLLFNGEFYEVVVFWNGDRFILLKSRKIVERRFWEEII